MMPDSLIEDRIERALQELEDIKRELRKSTGRGLITLGDVLARYGGSTEPFVWHRIDDGRAIAYQIDGVERTSEVIPDALSGEDSVFAVLPIRYLYHDEMINPRGVNLNLKNLIQEFGRGNPQLQQSLARIDGDRVRIFDGQHKTVARLLLGERSILVRIFLDIDEGKLMETNTRAGRALSQIEFDPGSQLKMSRRIFQARLDDYRRAHGYAEDDQSFLTDELINRLLADLS